MWNENKLLTHSVLSDLDQAIVAALQEDGRRSFVQIARDVRVTEKTVRTRVHHLLNSKTIQIVALTSPDALGYKSGGLVGLSLKPGVSAKNVTKDLVSIPEVDYVVSTAGQYAILAELISPTAQSMQQTIESDIGAIKGIQSIDVFPYFKIPYQQAKFPTFHGSLTTGSGVRPSALDDTDRLIIAELNIDGRAPMNDIAENLGISETQVRNRIKRMIDSNAMNILAIVNPMNLQYDAIAWVAINVQDGHSVQTLAEKIRQLSNISYVAICLGKYDVFVEVVCHSNEEMFEIIDSSIRTAPGAGRVEVFPYLDLQYKRLLPAPPAKASKKRT